MSIKKTIITGMLPLASISIFIILAKVFFSFIDDMVSPIVLYIDYRINEDGYIAKNIIYLLVSFLILTFSLFLGALFNSKIGSYIQRHVSDIVSRVPGIKIMRTIHNILKQLFDNNKMSFSEIGFAKPYGEDNSAIEVVFITDRFSIKGKEFLAVFTPTGPNPTTGFVRIMPADIIFDAILFENKLKVDETIRSIISCGIGFGELIENLSDNDKVKFLELTNK
jgi:uncharacterized membrane protein